jgi:hypothetical protein
VFTPVQCLGFILSSTKNTEASVNSYQTALRYREQLLPLHMSALRSTNPTKFEPRSVYLKRARRAHLGRDTFLQSSNQISLYLTAKFSFV